MKSMRWLATLLLLPLVLLAACGDDDDDDSTATAAPSATATEAAGTPTATASDDDTFTSTQLPVSVTVSPGAGFFVPDDADLPDLFAVVQTGDAGGYIDFVQPAQVYTYSSETESELGDPPEDYVQWFNELPYPAIVDTQDVTIGGLTGKRLEIKNANNENFAVFRLSNGSDYDIDYLGSGSILAYVIGDPGSQVLIFCGTVSSSSFASFKATCEQAVATVEFGS